MHSISRLFIANGAGLFTNSQQPIPPFTHTHTTQPLYGSVDFVRDNPGEPVPEGTFHDLLDFLEQNEDNTGRRINNLDGLPPHPD